MTPDILLRPYIEKDLEAVHRLVQKTIAISYAPVYPVEVIRFFEDHHSLENIRNEASNEYTLVAERDGEIIGTGALKAAYVHRVFVNTLYQHNGAGKLIYTALEKQALSRQVPVLELSSSLVSRQFWEARGFIIAQEHFAPMPNGQTLHYYQMTKSLLNTENQ